MDPLELLQRLMSQEALGSAQEQPSLPPEYSIDVGDPTMMDWDPTPALEVGEPHSMGADPFSGAESPMQAEAMRRNSDAAPYTQMDMPGLGDMRLESFLFDAQSPEREEALRRAIQRGFYQ